MVEEHLYPIKDRGSRVAVLFVYEGILCPFLDVTDQEFFKCFLFNFASGNKQKLEGHWWVFGDIAPSQQRRQHTGVAFSETFHGIICM